MTQPARLAIMVAILAVAIRLVSINQPYIDNWSWRQSDVAAIARNYFQGGFHFSRPQIDWAGDQPGYVGTEFPILPFFAAICYKLFGVHEWVGRVQAVILFAVSLPFFFLLVRELCNEIAATWALCFYSFAPLGIMVGRCFMPDMPSLAFAIVGLYFFQRWIRQDARTGSLPFWLSALCISLSILIKLPSILIGAPFAYLAFQRFNGLRAALRRSSLWIFAAIALIPSILWYGHAYEIARNFYPHHFFGAGGIKIMGLGWYLRILKLLITSTLTPFVFLLAVVGALTRSKPGMRVFHWWLGAMVLFIIVVGYGNRHPWYQLPLVPIACAFAGAGCDFLSKRIKFFSIKIALGVGLIISFGLVSFIYCRKFYRPSGAVAREIGLKLRTTTPRGALVVAADNGDPTVFYYAERKGWHFLEKDGIYDGEPLDGAQAIADLEPLRKRGARYLVFTAETSWWLDYYRELAEQVNSTATMIPTPPGFKIFELKPPQK